MNDLLFNFVMRTDATILEDFGKSLMRETGNTLTFTLLKLSLIQ